MLIFVNNVANIDCRRYTLVLGNLTRYETETINLFCYVG